MHGVHSPLLLWRNLSFLDEPGSTHGTVAAFEFIDAPSGIDKFLLAGEERVAGGADADLDVFAGGPGAIGCPACTKDHGLAVVGMDIRLHS